MEKWEPKDVLVFCLKRRKKWLLSSKWLLLLLEGKWAQGEKAQSSVLCPPLLSCVSWGKSLCAFMASFINRRKCSDTCLQNGGARSAKELSSSTEPCQKYASCLRLFLHEQEMQFNDVRLWAAQFLTKLSNILEDGNQHSAGLRASLDSPTALWYEGLQPSENTIPEINAQAQQLDTVSCSRPVRGLMRWMLNSPPLWQPLPPRQCIFGMHTAAEKGCKSFLLPRNAE